MRLRQIMFIVSCSLLFSRGALAYPILVVWGDSTHTDCSHFYSVPYKAFDVWVYANTADESGLVCAEFRIEIDSPHILVIDRRLNPAFEISEGENPDDDAGVGICSQECQTGWVYLYKLSLLPTQVVDQSIVLPGQRTPGLELGVNTCDEGNPWANFAVEAYCINIPCGCDMATENSSWGVIKKLITE